MISATGHIGGVPIIKNLAPHLPYQFFSSNSLRFACINPEADSNLQLGRTEALFMTSWTIVQQKAAGRGCRSDWFFSVGLGKKHLGFPVVLSSGVVQGSRTVHLLTFGHSGLRGL